MLYFPELKDHFKEVNDSRQLGKVLFSADLMLWLGLTQRLGGFKSNNEFELHLAQAPEIIKNLAVFMGYDPQELPSIDAFRVFLQKLLPSELHEVRKKLIVALERKKVLRRLMDSQGYLLLAIDGVQTFSTHRPIAHSTYKEHKDGTVTYHQYFIEAKIVSSDGFVISLDSEPVENPTSEFNKQDCENKAAKRLLERIGREHPHLKFRVLGDAYYCNSALMDICEKRRWKYSYTFKGETQHPKLHAEIQHEMNTRQRQNTHLVLLKAGKKMELYVELRWCNNLSYDFGAGGERRINYLEGKIIRVKDGVEKVVTTFSYLVSETTNTKSAFKKFMKCRQRWKIENQGFNVQKNSTLNIKHSYGSIGHAAHNYYLIAQIAHTIIQLAAYTDIAGQVRRKITLESDKLSQSLRSIFKTFSAIAMRVRIEIMERVFKPPSLGKMRVRLKFA